MRITKGGYLLIFSFGLVALVFLPPWQTYPEKYQDQIFEKGVFPFGGLKVVKMESNAAQQLTV
ncbi:MAG: hypothetical protein VR65_19790 [Desulfobulbaceae bacterium BRH_c16a]|nr:MAG: hypothetical protein VR65_19790 [Desulfobulbaceae bacterium BRH_c16a]